uniref:Uncharacterized protein n=1 Tax=Setaria viridis TaxID=4556 RepID=A0A4U6WCY9_SETVI|nr:hypothetical protein SEVIR_1G258000v2 [Setaria viridis]
MDGQVPATGDASAKRVGGLGRGATSTSSAGPRGRRGASPERDAEVARRGRAVWGYSFLSRCVSALARVEGCRHRYGVCLGEGSLYSFQPEPGRWREPNTSLFGVQFLTHLLLLDRAAESQMSLSACCVYVSREPLRVQQMVEPPARVLSLSGSGSPCTRAAVFALARDVKPSAVFSLRRSHKFPGDATAATSHNATTKPHRSELGASHHPTPIRTDENLPRSCSFFLNLGSFGRGSPAAFPPASPAKGPSTKQLRGRSPSEPAL